MINTNYSNYFQGRGVSDTYYDNYKLPAYIFTLLGENKKISILDFGCGFGQNLLAMKNLGYENICGYDIDPTAIDFCNKNNLEIIDGRSVPINKINNKYDLIIMTHVLEHLPKDFIVSTLQELRRILKDNGELFVAVPNAQSNTGCYWMYEDFTHQTLFTAGSLLFVLRQAGFSNISLHDRDCLIGIDGLKKMVRKYFLAIYRANNSFWNKVTASSYHGPSPVVNSYEVKMIAKN